MALAGSDLPQRQHPWIDTFLENPAEGLADLLSGYARIEPYVSAERPDAARMLFGRLATHHEARTALDDAVLIWLNDRRLEGVPALAAGAFERKLREIMDAFRIVSLLELPNAAVALRKHYVLWKSWVDRLAGAKGPDVRSEYLSTLALTQRLAGAQAKLNRLGLEPCWISICEQAGGSLPASYLHIGLLGLRFLPERQDMPNDRPWMIGLARWATVRRPRTDDFARQWLALKRLYPRTPAQWRIVVTETLKQRSVSGIPIALDAYWRGEVGAADQPTVNARTPKRTIPPPSLDAIQHILARAAEPLRKISPEIRRIIAEAARYAEVTGESHYLVRTACNVGMRLLESGPQSERAGRGKLAIELARQSLLWQPEDVLIWALWRDGLEAEGELEVAELVGWEAVRRFPEDPQRRNQLALLLSKTPARWDDAEALLRETIKRFPGNVVTQNQLAQLLARWPGREHQAKTLLQDILHADPDDEVARKQLDRLEHAHAASAPSGAPRPSHGLAEALADLAEAHKPLDDPFLRTILSGGRMRRLAARIAWNKGTANGAHAAQAEIRSILEENPNSDYARYLQSEIQGAPAIEATLSLGDFGAALVAAIRQRDPKALNAVEDAFPDPSQLFDMARVALFKDVAAAQRAAAWLSARSVGEMRPIVALRKFINIRLDQADREMTLIDDIDAFIEMVAANDNVELDLIEAALAPWDLVLAA